MNRIIAFYIFYILSINAFAQVSWRLNAEAGYFKNSGEDLVLQDDIITRLNGQLRFDYSNEPNEASLILNIHPEYFGSKNKTGLLKLNTSGKYLHYSDDLGLGFNFSIIKNNYFGDILDVKYDIFNVASNLLTSLFDRPFNMNLGYTYQNVNYSGNITYDLFFTETEILFVNNHLFTAGLGLYGEKFIIENEYEYYPNGKLSNKGWRAGPLLNLKYIKNFLISGSYRILFHKSTSVMSHSFEHQVTFVAGKVFFEKYSVFALADFYFRNFKLKEGIPGKDLIYSPVNQENLYSIKFAYELTNSTELFFRTGYSEENVDYIITNIAGWSFTLGFELR